MSDTDGTSISELPSWQNVIGIVLAISSSLFLGSSVVLRKRGLIQVEAKGTGTYLQNACWWIGMMLQAVGELCNFGAYAFSPTILVAPLGTLAIVFNAILSHFVLHDALSFLGKVGCALCVLGVVSIVTHVNPSLQSSTIPDFMSNVIHPVFLTYFICIILLILWLKFYAEPRYSKDSPFVYIAMSSCGGSFLVLSAQGVGSSIVTSAKNWNTNNQFLQWPLYPLIVFMCLAVVFQIVYLNKALAQNSSAVIYPVSYVSFTGMTLVSSAFLYRTVPISSVDAAISVACGFLVIVCGVIVLYTSQKKKAEPINTVPTKPFAELTSRL
ncbi:DUF803-domain-containing protein [Rhizoclosmatium globosum]|uniref:DUF803-domain-containing protein n=1 Tax=Rhizoclosmatium globosum TaxID=329046 RepID=A0A1Y2B392_9FUNG|nr:DUF803-domain-containing protein [Rhizoclosmatium globosum]|eukprot:ORY29293.1 DUF803-domain-containing protein [Rhizoclosmatium globosum]